MIVVEGGQTVVTGSRMDVVSDLAALIIHFNKNRKGDLTEAVEIAKGLGGNNELRTEKEVY
jgi:hypothetical protein